MVEPARDESERLARLWAGGFGDQYVERNAGAAEGRDRFWRDLLSRIDVASALEVGCNVGGNLRWLAEALGAEAVAGVDVNQRALEIARAAIPGAELVHAEARALPFPDDSYDLVFTAGVLIHIPDEGLRAAMGEIVRCSRRYVLCAEYHADETEEVPYRGQEGALFRRDYLGIYERSFAGLRLVDRGFLGDGTWDDVTYGLFEKA